MTPERYQRIREVLDRRQPDLTVLMDYVNKPHNFSAILRSCDAVGVFEAHAVTDRRYLKANKTASAGGGKWVQLSNHPNLEAAFGHLREQGMQVLVAHDSESAVDFRSVDYTLPTALVMGAELYGPSATSIEQADAHITVPMAGMTESLNVSVATAVILYEAQRQREVAGFYEAPRLDSETYWRTVLRWAYPKLVRECDERGLPYPTLREDDGELVDLPGQGGVES
jgi:tRNA (guanosine-2'-O-)-methyltransferase